MVYRTAPLAAQMFLTPGALFVLVVDMFAYSEDGHSREDALEQWLDILQARVPGSVVLLVGTHSDSFDSPAACSKRTERFLKGELLSSIALTLVGWRFSFVDLRFSLVHPTSFPVVPPPALVLVAARCMLCIHYNPGLLRWCNVHLTICCHLCSIMPNV